MIIAGAPTAKVCLSSLFFWIPGRGSVLINAHHVFFSMLVFRYLRLFFLLLFVLSPFLKYVRGSWCVMRYLDVSLLFSIWYIYALCSREWCPCVFFVRERWVVGDAVSWIIDCSCSPTVDVIYVCRRNKLARKVTVVFVVSSPHKHDQFLMQQNPNNEDVIFFHDQTA